MRTLQEKYNGVNEGAFSKEQFLRDARMQLPNLVTRFNGYDDAVQILKNRGMIQEEKSQMTTAELMDMIDKMPAGELAKDIFKGVSKDVLGGLKTLAKKGKKKLGDALVKFGYLEPDDLNEANLGPDEISSIHQEGDSWVVTYRKGDKKEKAFKTEKEARDFEKTISEARLTNKSLTDYRYKATNDMDKYPYEQILRGLRVELEGLQVTGTPTAEEYKKALAKVLKNLEKDEIYYTNQVAGISKKVDLHDKMVDVKKDNAVDTFNGLKKAQLKEGFKNLIKKVLAEGEDAAASRNIEYGNPYGPEEEYDLYNDEDKLEEGPAQNNPKIEKLVQGINQLIAQAVDSDGDPVGVIEPGTTWEEPYVYSPIEYKNGALKITSKSPYQSTGDTNVILARNMEMDGIPTLRLIARMYKKAVKKLGEANNYAPTEHPDEPEDDIRHPAGHLNYDDNISESDEDDDAKLARYKKYKYTLDGKEVSPKIAYFDNYIGADLDDKVYRLGSPDEKGVVALKPRTGKTGMYTESIFETVSLKDIL